MNFEKLKSRFLKLPLMHQLVFGGSFLSAISVFMPWYEDLDAFKTGDQFLGITGPLYLAGLVILLASLTSFTIIGAKVLDKKLPSLPLPENNVHVFAGALNVFLLLLVNSVYFHDKFGVNIAFKDFRFGMIVAVIGNLTLLLAGFQLSRQNQEPNFDTVGKIEPLIDMQNTPRVQRELHERESGDTKTQQVSEGVKSHVGETMEKAQEKPKPQLWRTDL